MNSYKTEKEKKKKGKIRLIMAMAVNVDTRQTIAAYRILFLKSLTAQNCSTISTAPSDKIDTCDPLTHCTNKNKELDLIQFSSAVKF